MSFLLSLFDTPPYFLSKQDSNPITDTYVEVIGSVLDGATIKMMACINLGPELGTCSLHLRFTNRALSFASDMKLVNDVVELIHDPRFYESMFS